jgi:hypothetical protein
VQLNTLDNNTLFSMIRNPATGRMVKRSGRVGQALVARSKTLSKKSSVVRGRPSRAEQALSREADTFGLDGKVFLDHGRSKSARVRAALKRSKSTKYENRPSPPYSATLYSVGFTMLGNDDQMYVIRKDKNGRHSWKRL